ncbi:hypothetical protein ACFQ45_09455 [Rhodanobacter aciditrophus]|uniref:Uncharacterized protein n=1 Tax=Rhodanobacter aciditrophus TaxID=1623218 RepID=A0ABW4B210_9GAMM
MLTNYLTFYGQLIAAAFMPGWYQKEFIDTKHATHHAHYRRTTEKYRGRRKIVRTLWTGTGILVLAFPTPPIMVGALLFSTCLSFAILDETE